MLKNKFPPSTAVRSQPSVVTFAWVNRNSWRLDDGGGGGGEWWWVRWEEERGGRGRVGAETRSSCWWKTRREKASPNHHHSYWGMMDYSFCLLAHLAISANMIVTTVLILAVKVLSGAAAVELVQQWRGRVSLLRNCTTGGPTDHGQDMSIIVKYKTG